MAVRVGKVTKTLSEFCKHHHFTVLVRNSSVWTKEGIIKSPYKDIVIPNCTLPEYVWRNLDKWSDKTLSVCGDTGKTYTYGQAHKQTRNFAANLRNKFKIKDGDTVVVMLPNIPEYPLVAMGVLEAGGVISTINPLYTPHEVERQLIMSGVKLIVTLPQLTNIVKQATAAAKIDIPVVVVRSGHETLPEGVASFSELSESEVDTSCLKQVKRNSNDICFLPYSSGTTGLPKGVELTHKNIVANCEQINEPLITANEATTATNQDSALAVLPFFHIYAATVLIFHKLSEGIKVVTLPKFQPEKFLQTLTDHKITTLFVAPPIVILMANHPGVSSENLKYVNTVVNGAAPLASSDAERLLGKAKQKLRFGQGFGLTETSPVVSMSDKISKDYDSVGNALGSTELRIVDTNMKVLGPNQTGEILVRGPQVMKGYRNNPEANSEVFLEDGWLRTGDLGIVNDDGILKIADRLKELIKVKGFQVPPAELEAILREHPSVNDAAVIGVPHPEKGEAPKAFVALKPGSNQDLKNIAEFVSKRVASYKRIDDIIVVDSIPKSAAGKILRKDLKQKYC